MKTFLKIFSVLVVAVAVVIVSAYALTDFSIGAKTQLYAGNSTSDISFTAKNNDSVRVQAPLLVNDKITAGGTKFAKIDSFTTTAALDTIVMSGASYGDMVLIQELTPIYSATPDTNVTYTGFVLNTDSVCARRTKNAATADLKSAAIYNAVLINK